MTAPALAVVAVPVAVSAVATLAHFAADAAAVVVLIGVVFATLAHFAADAAAAMALAEVKAELAEVKAELAEATA